MLPDPAEKPTLTVEEAAPIYGVSKNLLRQAIAAGEVPSLRLGRRVLLPTAAVRRQLQVDVDLADADMAFTADELHKPLRAVRSAPG